MASAGAAVGLQALPPPPPPPAPKQSRKEKEVERLLRQAEELAPASQRRKR